MVIKSEPLSIILCSNIHHNVALCQLIWVSGPNNYVILKFWKTFQHCNRQSFITMKGAIMSTNGLGILRNS